MKKSSFFSYTSLALFIGAFLFLALLVTCGGGGGGSSSSPSTGTVTTSISDPPTCQTTFQNVWVTITRVRAHVSGSAGPNDNGWVDLRDLRDAPMQIDLMNLSQTDCLLTQLGSTSGIPSGQYQQIRLFLLSNNPGGGTALPASNNCGNNGFNCVVTSSGIQTLQLSSEAQTGIKIPSGQIAGGSFIVPAGQVVDLDIDFDACSSIVQQGNGQFRLKPVLHAAEVSLNNPVKISGKVVDNSVTPNPISGAVVFLEQPDASGIDRMVMQTLTKSDGTFIFCPLSSGTYDVVVGGKNGATIYIPTITLGVGAGTAMGNIALFQASGSANISGQVTAQITTAGEVDIDISALQNANSSLRVTVPVLQGSTPTTVTTQNGIANYSLSVPAGNPRVGSFNSGGTSYNPVSGDYVINAQASNCDQSSQLTPPLNVSPGGTSTAQSIAFTGCSGN